MEKQNDWIVANINNPNFTNEDYRDVLGMSVDNTQLQTSDYYKKSQFITNNPAFQKSDGSGFDEQKFDDYYKQLAASWGSFSEDAQIDNFQYSLFDTRATPSSKIRDPHFRFETVRNPDRQTIGISGWNQVGKKQWTPSELAQTQKIFDPNTGQYLDETPNDLSLVNSPIKYIKSLFQDPLVLAAYDEDGEHFDPFSGEVVKHKKGELKLNDDGTYYTEKLNGRSTIGKQVISSFDILTVDGEGINKYDFFDSDSLDKSTAGTIAKNVAAVVPMLLGGPVGQTYSALLIARELSKTLPMLYGMTTALFGNEEDSTVLNTIAAYGEKFSGGNSQYAKEHTFSFENIGNLMSDVALQWGQQKLISKAFNKLRNPDKVLKEAQTKAFIQYQNSAKELMQQAESDPEKGLALIAKYLTPKEKDDWTTSLLGKTAIEKFMPEAEKAFEKSARFGANAALAYMALISNTDVYASMLEHGTTRREAALVALGSTLGMYGVDRYLNLGETFFEDLRDESKLAIKRFTREETDKLLAATNEAVGTSAKQMAEKEVKEGELNLFRRGVLLGRSIAEKAADTFKNYRSGLKNHTLGAVGKSLGEGLEEVSEEFVSDMCKQLYEWAGELGADTSVKDVGAWDNWQDRYAMSLIGGALGGGLFYGVEQIQKARQNQGSSEAKDGENEVIYMLRQHKKQQLLDDLRKQRDKGELASTKLSIDHVFDKDNNPVYITADDEHISQNEFVYRTLVDQINQLDMMISTYGMDMSEDELFKQMVLGNERLMQYKQALNGQAYSTGYHNLWQGLTQKLIDVQRKLIKVDNDLKNLTDEERREDSTKEQSLLALKKQLQEKETALLKERDDFKSGNKSLYYARKMLFLSDPIVSSRWVAQTFEQWLLNEKNLEVEKISPAEKQKYVQEYLIYKKAKERQDIDQRFDNFLQLEAKITPFLTELAENEQATIAVHDQFEELNNLRKQISDIMESGYWNRDTQLPDETKEQFDNRNTPAEGETEEQFNARDQERVNLINQHNEEVAQNEEIILDKIQKITSLIESSNVYIDPLTYRSIVHFLSGSTRDLEVKRAISESLYKRVTDETGREILTLQDKHQELQYNLIKQVVNGLADKIAEYYEKKYKQSLVKLQNLSDTLSYIQSDVYDGNELYTNSKYWSNIGDLFELDNPNVSTVDAQTIKQWVDNNKDSIIKRLSDKYVETDKEINEITSYDVDQFNANDFNIFGIDTTRVETEVTQDPNEHEGNKTLKIYLKGQRSKGYFELVKDREFGQFSVHFKTGNADTHEIYGSTREEREILYQELINAIPEGATVSTWGNVSEGGIRALERVGRDMTKIGQRAVKDREGNPITIPVFKKGEATGSNTHEPAAVATAIADVIKENLQQVFNQGNLETAIAQLSEIVGAESVFSIDDIFKVAITEAVNPIIQLADQFGELRDTNPDEWESLIDNISDSMASSILKGLNKTNLAIFKGRQGKAIKDELKQNILQFWKGIAKNLQQDIEQSPYVKFFDVLKAKIRDNNPANKLIELAVSYLGIDPETVKSLLAKFQARYEEGIEDFTLTAKEQEIIDDLSYLLELLKTQLHQVSTSPNWLSPGGTAKFINDFIAKNKAAFGEVQPLAEMDSGLAQTFINELTAFQNELEKWRQIHANNRVNKKRQFIKAKEARNKAIYEFYRRNSKAFTNLKIGEHTYTLIDFTSERPDELEAQLANNVATILEKEKISFIEFLRQSKLIENVTDDNLSDIIHQVQPQLDDKLQYEDFTNYTKIQIIITALLNNSNKFNKYIKQSINADSTSDNKIAPLAIQEHGVRVGYAFVDGEVIIKELYSYLTEIVPELKNIPILDNIMFIEGIGGAGKTKAEAKRIVDSHPDKSVLLVAPKDRQVDNLFNGVGKGNKSNKTAFIKSIIEDGSYQNYLSMMADLDKGNSRSSFYQLKYDKTRNETLWISDKIKVKKDANAPNIVIIDEVTHFSQAELQIINNWASLNKVRIITLGHGKQQGYSKSGGNISAVSCFTLFRTPILYLSLRESNVQVSDNNANILNVLDEVEQELINYADVNTKTQHMDEFSRSKMKDIRLVFYNQEQLNGTAVTKQLSEKVIQNLKDENKEVAYVGEKDSDIAKQLTDAGIKFILLDEEQLQGQEFDFLIYDKQWKYDLSDEKSGITFAGWTGYNLIKKLYTVVSRMQQGGIIIDKGFTDLFSESTEQFVTAKANSIQDSIDLFIEDRLKEIDELNLDGPDKDLSTYKTPTTEETPEEQPQQQQQVEQPQPEEQQQQDENPEGTEQKTEDTSLQDIFDEQQEEEDLDDGIEIHGLSVGEDNDLKTIKVDNIRGYYLPVMGQYTRVSNGDEHITQRLEVQTIKDSENREIALIKDLGVITLFDNELKDKDTLDKSDIIKAVYKVDSFNKSILSREFNSSGIGRYITAERFNALLDGTSKVKLADGRTEGIYIEAVEPSDGDMFYGLTNVKESKQIIRNERMYKYVLRFRPDPDIYVSTYNDKPTEFEITLCLAADPKTWREKLAKLNPNGKTGLSPEEIAEMQTQYNDLNSKILKYEAFLDYVAKQGPRKMKLGNGFVRTRELGKKLRLQQMIVTADSTDRGRKERVVTEYHAGLTNNADLRVQGGIKYYSRPLIIGNAATQFGLSKQSIGKVGVLGSYKNLTDEEMIRIYQEERLNHSKSPTVRLMVMDNAGVPWSTLMNVDYYDIYRKQFTGKNGEVFTEFFPHNRMYTGQRLFVAMWNWRANLLQFQKAYKDEFVDGPNPLSEEQITNILKTIDELYFNKKSKKETEEAILQRNNVTKEQIARIQRFNNETCKNIHQFRLGGSTHGFQIQTIVGVDVDTYYKQLGVNKPKSAKNIYGVYLTPKTLNKYVELIQKVFDVFNNDSLGINLDEIIVKKGDKEQRLSKSANINSDVRLSSISGKITQALKDRKIEVDMGNNNKVVLDLSGTGSASAMAQFYSAMVLTFAQAKGRTFRYLTDPGEFPEIIPIKLKNASGEEIELNTKGLMDYCISDVSNSRASKGTLIAGEADDTEFRFTLGDMFDLMLHGTTQDIFDPKVLKATDAYMKKGIFTDPHGRRQADNSIGGNKNTFLFKYADLTDPRLIETNLDIDYCANFSTVDEVDEGEAENPQENTTIQGNYNKEQKVITFKGDISLPQIITETTEIGGGLFQDLLRTIMQDSELNISKPNQITTGDGEKYNLIIDNNQIKLELEPKVISKKDRVYNITDSDFDFNDVSTGTYINEDTRIIDIINETFETEVDEDTVNLTQDDTNQNNFNISVGNDIIGQLSLDSTNRTITCIVNQENQQQGETREQREEQQELDEDKLIKEWFEGIDRDTASNLLKALGNPEDWESTQDMYDKVNEEISNLDSDVALSLANTKFWERVNTLEQSCSAPF